MKRNKMRLGALGAAAALTAMSIAPAMGAEVVSQSSASAITIGVAGEGGDSGRVTATNDGSGEEKTGETNPPVSVLAPQDLLNLGVLAQDAAAQVQDGDGISAACAGVAGDGGSVAEIGDSNCIFPGQPVGIDIANLDLTGTIVINPDSALAPLGALAQPLHDQALAVITAEVAAALAPLASTGLNGTFGAIQARCNATPGQANGSATLVDTRLFLTVGDEEIAIATIPANPDPNTKVITDLDEVLAQVVQGVQQTLQESLEGQLAPLGDPLTQAIEEQIINNLVAQVADGLQPIEENILDITLNKQSSDGPGHIDVTALDLQLLPAAQEFSDSSLVDLQIANVTCGPNSTLAPAPQPEATPDEDLPEIPTVVDSGVSGGAGNPALVAGLLMLMGAAALVGYRRLLPAGK
ncbi:MAG: hypothetical protein Q8Q02_10085 [Nocardioides sp.]|nr:hypothetical protein [Nocardioides sp.]